MFYYAARDLGTPRTIPSPTSLSLGRSSACNTSARWTRHALCQVRLRVTWSHVCERNGPSVRPRRTQVYELCVVRTHTRLIE